MMKEITWGSLNNLAVSLIKLKTIKISQNNRVTKLKLF